MPRNIKRILLVVGMMSCSRLGTPASRTVNEHGIAVGDSIATMQVRCYGGPDRTVGGLAAMQPVLDSFAFESLVEFAAGFDRCFFHGLDSSLLAQFPVRQFEATSSSLFCYS